MTDMFLLGAGASFEAKVPVAFEMTRRMLNTIESDINYLSVTRMLRFILGGLMFQKGINGEDPTSGVNIEELFNTVNELQSREKNPLSPFISSWHPLFEKFKAGYSFNHDHSELEKEIKKMVLSRNNFSDFSFRIAFEKSVHQVIDSDSDRVLITTSDVMIKKLVDMVWIKEKDKVEYLNPLVLYAKEKNASIATLNYDNSIELAASSLSINIDSGIDNWLKHDSIRFNSTNIPLIKLHGSINWEINNRVKSIDMPIEHDEITIKDLSVNVQSNYKPAIIFGGKNKLTTRGPFLDLLRVFQEKLAICDRLIIIGYSFADAHINDLITNWFNQNLTHSIIIVDIKFPPRNNHFAEMINNIGSPRIKTYIMKASEAISKIDTL
jgi:hypothetical protein